MTWGVFRSPLMHSTGHFRAQTVQPLHLVGSMEIFSSAEHSWAGHFLSRMCASYSSRKYRMVVSTGLGAVWPRPHREPSLMLTHSCSSISMSPS